MTQTKVYLISGHVSLAGLLWGLDTGCVGPVTSMSQFEESFGVLSTGLRGLFIAIFLIAAAVASLVNGTISDRFSRKWTICLGALVCTLGNIVSASSSSLAQLFVGRIIFGIGTGLAFSCCTTYIVEIAPSELRGRLSCMIQLSVSTGIMIGYFFTYGTLNIAGSYAWRVPFLAQALFGLILAAGIPFLPYSPRWLLSKQREADAIDAMCRLRGSENLASILVEIAAIKAIIAADAQQSSSYREVFSRKLRHQTWLSLFLMTVQQASGVDVVLYFAPTIFKSAGLQSQSAAFLASAISGIVIVLATVPGFYSDKLGRRNPTLIGGTVMFVAMFCMAICFVVGGSATDDGLVLKGKGLQWTVVMMVYIFVAAFQASWAVVIRTYCAEIIPTRQRSRAAALQQYVNWTANFVIAISASSFLKASTSGAFFFYGACCLFGVLISALYMRESKGQSLETMHELFEPKVKTAKSTAVVRAVDVELSFRG